MSLEQLVEQLQQHRHQVDFDTYDITVQQLVEMVSSGAIDVAPVYQRQFRWDPVRRSHLIESVLLGVPVPSLFMATNKDGTWELVDGVQRLSTLVQFAGNDEARKRLLLGSPLELSGLDKLTEFNGYAFGSLPQSIQLHFLLRPIKVVTLSDKSDKAVRFDLFERLNTGGISLTNQEIRACVYRGRFIDFVSELADSPDFSSVVRLTDKQKADGTREECVLRFFAFLHRYQQFDHSVVDFLNSFTKSASERFDYSQGRDEFAQTFRELSSAFPQGIVRPTGRRITPINLFEGVAVGAALALKERKHLDNTGIEVWMTSPELRRYTTGATNNKLMVTSRIEFCRDRFLGR